MLRASSLGLRHPPYQCYIRPRQRLSPFSSFATKSTVVAQYEAIRSAHAPRISVTKQKRATSARETREVTAMVSAASAEPRPQHHVKPLKVVRRRTSVPCVSYSDKGAMLQTKYVKELGESLELAAQRVAAITAMTESGFDQGKMTPLVQLHYNLHIIRTTQSVVEAWNAYHQIVSSAPYQQQQQHTKPREENAPHAQNIDTTTMVPRSHLHRLARLISRTRPRTRTLFVSLFTVLSHLERLGPDNVALWEWNALINFAGKGYRKTRPVEFASALDVYNDLVSRQSTLLSNPSAAPVRRGKVEEGQANNHDHDNNDAGEEKETKGSNTTTTTTTTNNNNNSADAVSAKHSNTNGARHHELKPDIYTYTTLIDIAARSDADLVRYASALFKASGLPPNRITHLALIQYFTRSRRLDGVRETLTRMRQHGLELGLDGIGTALWAFVSAGNLDVPAAVYRVLRHNIVPESEEAVLAEGQEDGVAAAEVKQRPVETVEEVRERLRDEENIDIPVDMVPDQTIYTMMVQSHAYQGDFDRALQTFMDMLSTVNTEDATVVYDRRLDPLDGKDKDEEWDEGEDKGYYTPTMGAFRAMFLGFYRHAAPHPSLLSLSSPFTRRMRNIGGMPVSPFVSKEPWNMENLQKLFETFMSLSLTERAREMTLYWILMAFVKVSGDDKELIVNVWDRLAERCPRPWRWRGRLHMLGVRYGRLHE